MSNDNKTLADVQPGGMVRLGDQAERARFEAWAEDRELGTAKCSADGMNGDYADLSTDWCWAAWQAALSAQPSPGAQAAHCPVKHCGMTYARVPSDGRCHACGATVQPSPGGQGDARAIIEEFVQCATLGRPQGKLIAQAKDYLAARQPVTMDDALAAGDGTLHGSIDHWQERALRAEAELAARQPVGEPVAYLDLGAGGYMDVGTDLSDDELAALPKGRHMLGIIGTYGMDGYKPAQAVDLGQFREAVSAWRSECSRKRMNSIGGPAYIQASAELALKEASRLLALIDKAVGND